MTETEQYYDENGLPWGTALIPEWWQEVTPHHVMDLDEFDRPQSRADGKEAVFPFSLPGFQPSDGLDNDASFLSDGQQWFITDDGYFYRDDEKSVLHTAANMVEAGHLEPGMDALFVQGWEHKNYGDRGATPTGQYAKSDEIAWEKPAWMKKKLRKTNSRDSSSPAWPEGGRDSESPSRMARSSPRAPTPRSLSPVPRGGTPNEDNKPAVPAWKLKRQQILKEKADAEAQAEAEAEARATEAAAKAEAVNDKENHQTDDNNNAAAVAATAAATAPSWKKKTEEETSSSPSVPAWKKKAEEQRGRSTEPVVPAWKKKQEEKASSRPSWLKKQQETDDSAAEEPSATPTSSSTLPPWKQNNQGAASPSWKKKQEETASSPVPAWKKKQEETTTTSVPAWKKKQEETKAEEEATAAASVPEEPKPAEETTTSAPNFWKKKQQEGSAAAVPAWKKKQQESKTEAAVPAWKKKQEESKTETAVPAWKKKQQETAAASSTAPSWQKKQEEEKQESQSPTPTHTKPQPHRSLSPGRTIDSSATPKQEEEKPKRVEEVAKPAPVTTYKHTVEEESEDSESEAEEDEEAGKLVSQGLVLKLIALPDDASRAKELRNTVAATPENNNKVMVKPNELLAAIAHHAQTWKGQADAKDKITSLRQVAIIARLVIMKLYGAGAPELKQFEDGLRPAFA